MRKTISILVMVVLIISGIQLFSQPSLSDNPLTIPDANTNVASDKFNDSYLIMLYGNFSSSKQVVCVAKIDGSGDITKITSEYEYSTLVNQPSDVITLNQTDFVVAYKDSLTDEYCRVRVGRFSGGVISWVTSETVLFPSNSYNNPHMCKLTETSFALVLGGGGFQFVGVISGGSIDFYASEGVGENYYQYSVLAMNETYFVVLGMSSFPNQHYQFGLFHFTGSSVEIITYEEHDELDDLDWNTNLYFISETDILVGLVFYESDPRVSVYHINEDNTFSEIGYVLVDLKDKDSFGDLSISSLTNTTFFLYYILYDEIGEEENLYYNYLYSGSIQITGEEGSKIATLNMVGYETSAIADDLDSRYMYNLTTNSTIITFRTNDEDSDWGLLYETFNTGIFLDSPYPNSDNIPLNPTLNITVTDVGQPETLDIYFKTNASGTWENIGTYQSYAFDNESKYFTQETNDIFDEYGTVYTWSVNVTNGTVWENQSYVFTTRPVTSMRGSIILRPNADGTTNQWTPKSGDDRYTQVYEEVADGSSTEIHRSSPGYQFLNIDDSPVGLADAIINNVTMHIIMSTSATEAYVSMDLRDSGGDSLVSVSDSTQITAVYPDAWEEVTATWSDTFGEPWDWSTIDSLQIDVSSGSITGGDDELYCTQAWLEVNYQNVSLSDEVPSNGDYGIELDLSVVSVDIITIGEQLINWIIGGENITTTSGTDDTSGTKQANVIGPLEYGTEYTWWVNVSGGSDYINTSYVFTTEFSPAFFIDDLSVIGAPNGRALARAPDGTLYCVYVSGTIVNNVNDLFIASSTNDGVTWTSTLLYEGPEFDGTTMNPCIAIDSLGNISVFWQGDYEYEGDLQIRYILYREGSWGSPSNMTDNADDNEYPSIAYDNNDFLHIVWSTFTGEGCIEYTFFDGVEFSSMTPISIGDYDEYPSIVVDGLNRLHVVWYDDDAGAVWYSMNDSVSWSEPVEFIDLYAPCIAVDKENVVHIACSGMDGDDSAVFYITYDGEWSEPTPIYSGFYGSTSPSISVDDADVVHVVFPAGINFDIGVIIHMNKSGLTWSDGEGIASYESGMGDVYVNLMFATYPNISGFQPNIKDTGYSLVYWDGTMFSIYYYSYPEPFIPPIIISDITASPNPQLQGGIVGIECYVEAENLNLVKVNISGPEGFSTINVSMTGDPWFYYENTYDIPGTYTYFIWANDTEGNSEKSSNSTFEIEELVYTYLYVDADFDEETPDYGVYNFSSIQDAVDNADEYYFIYVNGDGDVYNENVLIEQTHIILFGNYTTTRPSVVGQSATKSTFEIMADDVNVSGFSVNNLIGKASYHGIAIGKTQALIENHYNCSITNCRVIQANDGILSRGGYNTFADCEIETSVTTGIWCLGVSNIIDNNSIHNCKTGIDIYLSSNNVISNNSIVSNDWDGLKLESASGGNIIHINNFTSNGDYGVKIGGGCNNNWVYNNNFVNNNGVGTQANDVGTNNYWNMSYPICGNYWDDHDITDDYSGELQNEPGSDGIVDEGGTFDPYVIGGSNDWYPFVSPFNGSYPYVPFFEPGPTNNTPHIDVVAMYLTCTVANPGAQPMDVSFYWGNGTLIGTLEDVESGTEAELYLPDFWSRTIMVGETPYEVTWLEHDTIYYWYINTTYDETTLQSNIWNFHTSRAWDLNANGAVNYLDVSLFVSNYGVRVIPPGENSWDINEDTHTNYLDLSLLVSHYGETY